MRRGSVHTQVLPLHRSAVVLTEESTPDPAACASVPWCPREPPVICGISSHHRLLCELRCASRAHEFDSITAGRWCRERPVYATSSDVTIFRRAGAGIWEAVGAACSGFPGTSLQRRCACFVLICFFCSPDSDRDRILELPMSRVFLGTSHLRCCVIADTRTRTTWRNASLIMSTRTRRQNGLPAY